MTIAELLRRGARELKEKHADPGVRHDHALDAKLLVMQALKINGIDLILREKQEVTPEEKAAFDALLARRINHEPIAYLTGTREFHHLSFSVRPGVLIPRPETELMVDAVIEHLGSCKAGHCVADVGTGSGAIACAVAHATNHPVFAIDFSKEAFFIARENIENLRLGNKVKLLFGNGIQPLEEKGAFKECEEAIILANLPYVPTRDWENAMEDVKRYEPREALDGGPDGLDLYRMLFNQLEELPIPFVAWCEIDPSQAKSFPEEAKKRIKDIEVSMHKDLAGKYRLGQIRRGKKAE